MKIEHYALIGGVAVLAAILFAKRGCSQCKVAYGAITNQTGPWPGAGSGVAQ